MFYSAERDLDPSAPGPGFFPHRAAACVHIAQTGVIRTSINLFLRQSWETYIL